MLIMVLLIYKPHRHPPTQFVSPGMLVEDMQPDEWASEIESWREQKTDLNLQTGNL